MNDQSSNWSDGIPSMVALAERFAAEGKLNLNKLLEAAVYARTRRAAWHYRPEVTIETMQAELRSSIQALQGGPDRSRADRSIGKRLPGDQ